MTIVYLKLALDPEFGQKCPKAPKIMHMWSPSPQTSTKTTSDAYEWEPKKETKEDTHSGLEFRV